MGVPEEGGEVSRWGRTALGARAEQGVRLKPDLQVDGFSRLLSQESSTV